MNIYITKFLFKNGIIKYQIDPENIIKDMGIINLFNAYSDYEVTNKDFKKKTERRRLLLSENPAIRFFGESLDAYERFKEE